MKLYLALAGLFVALIAMLGFYSHTAEAQAGDLVGVTDQIVTHSKSFSLSYFATGVPQAGEDVFFPAPPGATSFANTWGPTSAVFSGVTINGESSLDYGFSNNTFTFSTATDTSRSGTSTEDITASPRGSGELSVIFTLNRSATVTFDTSGAADNNGTGGSGGSPNANASLAEQTGVDPVFGDPTFTNVFPSQSAFDSTVGDGSATFTFGDSATLAPGTYRISASAGVQNAYHQRLTTVSSSAQTTSVDLTASFVEPCPGGLAPVVNSEAELNEAIVCFNNQTPVGDHTITLGSSFSTAAGTTAIDQTINGSVLTLDGAGETLTGPGAGGDALFTAFTSAIFDSVTVTGSGADGIQVWGGFVVVRDSTLTGNGNDGIEVGNSASVLVLNSRFVDNFENGIRGNSGTVSVDSSTFGASPAGDQSAGIFADGSMSVSVSNSTFHGHRNYGVSVWSIASVSVSNSTISGNNYGFIGVAGAAMTAESSILSGNFTSDCSGNVIDGGANFASDATCPLTFGAITPALLGPLADNGCATPTTTGCVETMALIPSAEAIQAGDCTGVTLDFGMTGDLLVDQRGESRDPNACDAGSYELPPVAFCDGKLVTINMNLNGGNGNGTASADVILGTPGPDQISGSGGDDTICAGGGDDTIRGGAGADTIFGDAGADTIRGGGGGDIIDGGGADDTILGQAGPDIIDGGTGNDEIDGQGAADTIDGGTGDDTINGQNGADVMRGSSGNDTIKGQTGPDEIRGDADDDDLGGGNGNDTLYGGPGFDKCAGNTGPADAAQTSTCETTPGVEVLF